MPLHASSAITLNWILLGLDNANHNVGCLEPNNITVNTKRLGDSLKDHLIAKGVKFSNGKEVKLVTRNNQIQYIQDGEMVIKGTEVLKWKLYEHHYNLLLLYFTAFFSEVYNQERLISQTIYLLNKEYVGLKSAIYNQEQVITVCLQY